MSAVLHTTRPPFDIPLSMRNFLRSIVQALGQAR
ncbi:hypothetical protein T4D_1156 [Trichinella pseudospiralis]|uniref:Uncharacterized protein n=1 Tax=Trichinella pseudospiralis TaxID=6337 RepID=A0A0V1EKS5_TRIPS|nr:hypothetical protein T4D_1156 [Trichinella pseudospiralis]